MKNSGLKNANTTLKVKVPYWIKLFWIIILPGTFICLNQALYDIFYITYNIGPFSIGIPHIDANPILGLFIIFSIFALIFWCLVYIIWIIKIKVESKKPEILWYHISTVLTFMILYLIGILCFN